jgi:hypothetical protein
MLLNVFVPHIPARVWFRSYTPGVVTAVMINLPVMGYLAMRALGERKVCHPEWRRSRREDLMFVEAAMLEMRSQRVYSADMIFFAASARHALARSLGGLDALLRMTRNF